MKRTISILLLAAATALPCYAAGRRTQALGNDAWAASEWISAANAPVITGPITGANERAADGASWFLSTVRNDRKVKSAVWMTAGLGVYDLYVNGRLIGDEVLKPGFTHPEKTKRSFTYDVTDAINRKAGAENSFSVESTPGWWADKIVTPGGHDGMKGRKPAFRGVLQVTYDDGTTRLYGTNTTDWSAGVAGPITHAAIFDGEAYDSRIRPGHDTPELLGKPEVNSEFGGDILPSQGAEIYMRDDLAMQPVKAYVWKGVSGQDGDHFGKVNILREYTPGKEIQLAPGETLVLDFGQNCAAVPEFVFSAAEGTRVSAFPSELLNDGNGARSRGMDGPEGSTHRLNLRIPDTGMLMDYTFGTGKGYATYRPTHTFYGYRFLSVTADGDIRIKTIRSVPVTSIARDLETGTLETGHDMVNRLISNTLWGQRSNYLSVPTDCPQRNERLGWTADTQVFAETGTYFANTRDFFHKWMRDMRDSQHPLGGFPGVAPTAQYGGEHTRLGWSDAGIIVPWVVWKQFADTAIVNENWAAMEKYIDHLDETNYDHFALMNENGNYQWADWLSYEPLESCSGRMNSPDGILPETHAYWNYLSANYWLMDAEMMRDMAAATGRDAARFSRMADKARKYIKEKFIDGKGNFTTPILNTMQTPALFALRNNTVEGEARKAVADRLRKNFAEHDNCLRTGFLGTSILMPTLTENGMADIAYELLFQRKNPSWMYSIDNGATTIWERWNSYMLDTGMGPQGMNSFNHYAYGVVCEWMWESMAGIAADTSVPGFSRIIMKPVPDRRLGYVKAEYKSAAGTVKSHWKYDGDTWTWKFTVPKGATALVTVPGDTAAKEYAAGSYTVTRKI